MRAESGSADREVGQGRLPGEPVSELQGGAAERRLGTPDDVGGGAGSSEQRSRTALPRISTERTMGRGEAGRALPIPEVKGDLPLCRDPPTGAAWAATGVFWQSPQD